MKLNVIFFISNLIASFHNNLRFISFLGAGVFDDDRPVRSLKPVGSVASRLSDLVSRRTVESGQDQRRCIEEEEEERRRRRRGTI